MMTYECPPELQGVASPAFDTAEEAEAWTTGYRAGYAARAKEAAPMPSAAPSCVYCSHPMVRWVGPQWQCAMTTCRDQGVVVTCPDFDDALARGARERGAAGYGGNRPGAFKSSSDGSGAVDLDLELEVRQLRESLAWALLVIDHELPPFPDATSDDGEAMSQAYFASNMREARKLAAKAVATTDAKGDPHGR